MEVWNKTCNFVCANPKRWMLNWSEHWSWKSTPTMATIIVNLFVWFLFLPLSRELYLDCRISEQQKNQHGWSCLSSGGADEQTVKGLFGSPRGLLGNGGLSCGRDYFCVRGLVKVTSYPLLALLGFWRPCLQLQGSSIVWLIPAYIQLWKYKRHPCWAERADSSTTDTLPCDWNVSEAICGSCGHTIDGSD